MNQFLLVKAQIKYGYKESKNDENKEKNSEFLIMPECPELFPYEKFIIQSKVDAKHKHKDSNHNINGNAVKCGDAGAVVAEATGSCCGKCVNGGIIR